MLPEFEITDNAFRYIKTELAAGSHWLAYNYHAYHVDTGDVHLFNNEEEAREFSKNNYCDRDDFKVVVLDSVADIMPKVTDHERVHGEGIYLKHKPGSDTILLYIKDGNGFINALIQYMERNQFNHSKKQML